jgi:hypothetical protein
MGPLKKTHNDRKQIEELMRERDIINKNVIKTDEKSKKQVEICYKNAGITKKMILQIDGFKTEATKMARHIYVLEKDKEK